MWTCADCGGLVPIGSSETCLHCDEPLPRRTPWALKLTALLGPAGALLLAACYGAPGRYGYQPATSGSPPTYTGEDRDGDGVVNGTDCDDEDRARYPGAPDTQGDGIDQNCDGIDGIAPGGPAGSGSPPAT